MENVILRKIYKEGYLQLYEALFDIFTDRQLWVFLPSVNTPFVVL